MVFDDLCGLSRLVRLSPFLSFSSPPVSRRTNVRRLRLAPVREESAIGVAERSQVFKWLPCSFTSARRPKCGWDPGRRGALLPEATAKARPRNDEKKNQRRHLALRSRRERRRKTRESRRQCFNPSRALLRERSRTRTHRRCPRETRRCRNEMFSFVNIAFLSVEQAGYNLAVRVPARSWMRERISSRERLSYISQGTWVKSTCPSNALAVEACIWKRK